MTQTNEEAYATMIMGYQKDLDAAVEAKDMAKMKKRASSLPVSTRR